MGELETGTCIQVDLILFQEVASYPAFPHLIFITYSMKNRGGKFGHKCHDDACPNVTNLTLQLSLGPRNFVPMQAPMFGPNAPKFKNFSNIRHLRTLLQLSIWEKVSEASPSHGSP